MKPVFKKVIMNLAILGLVGLCSLVLWPGASFGEVKRIELTDGTVIYGDLISVEKGCWTISSDTLGIIKLDPSKIKEISSDVEIKGTMPSEEPDSPKNKIGEIKNKIQADSEIMEAIRSLQDDPQVKQVLQDPTIIKAIQTNDVSYLMSNPKFLAIMQNPQIKEICQKLMEKNRSH